MSDNPNITAAVMQQYENLRQIGATNMLDITGVGIQAQLLGYDDLLEIVNSREAYMELLNNFSHYMRKFDITQD